MSSHRETYWPVRLTTDRLHIREPGEADRSSLVRLVTDPQARRYLGGAVSYANPSALEMSPLGLTWGQWVIAHGATDQMLGYISLSYDRDELEISYALLPEHVGNGYAKEACLKVIEYAETSLGEKAVIAVVNSAHKSSVSSLKRLGFSIRKGFEEFGAQLLLMELPLPRRALA